MYFCKVPMSAGYPNHLGVISIGVFFDGGYVNVVRKVYKNKDPQISAINLPELVEIIRKIVSDREKVEERLCKVVDVHYFIGRRMTKDIINQQDVANQRAFEDVLMSQNIILHSIPLSPSKHSEEVKEKGIDVLLALEAYELAFLKRFDICVLVTGDGDFVPLVRKLHTLRIKVVVAGWDEKSESLYVAAGLKSEATHFIELWHEIDGMRRKLKDQLFSSLSLFVKSKSQT